MAVVAKVCRVRVHCNCFFSGKSKKVKRSVTNATQTLRVLSTQTLWCCPSIRFSVVLHCPQLLTSCWVFCGTRQYMLSEFLIFPLQQTFFKVPGKGNSFYGFVGPMHFVLGNTHIQRLNTTFGNVKIFSSPCWHVTSVRLG